MSAKIYETISGSGCSVVIDFVAGWAIGLACFVAGWAIVLAWLSRRDRKGAA